MADPTNAFTAEHGTKQGRLRTDTAPSGLYSMQLGHASAGIRRRMKSGDRIRLEATFDLTNMRMIRFASRFRAVDSARMPSGYVWIFRGMIEEYLLFEMPIDRTFESDDFAIPTDGMIFSQGAPTLPVQFELGLGGPIEDGADIELPGVEIDALLQDGKVDLYEVCSRNPGAAETAIPLDYTFRFTVAQTATFDFVNTMLAVSVNGVPAIVAGVVQAGWSGQITSIFYGCMVELLKDTPFDPLTMVTVAVSVSGDDIASWSFETADTIAPVVESAFAPSATTVRVVFDESMDESTVLDPDSYVLSLDGGAPAVVPDVVAVEFEAPRTVILTLATFMTRNALYRVTVSDATDVFGNVITAPLNDGTFAGYRWPVPAGRRTNLFAMLPENIRVKDESGEHERFLGVMQELFDIYYGIADRSIDIIDPDFAPIEWVDLMLLDLGNPFDFLELNDIEKRILVQTLLAIYKTKGTGPGIVNALRFFLGIEVSIRMYAWAPYPIGAAIMGETFVLGSSEQSDLYTFEVVVTVFLTDTERRNLTAIVDYMKVAHEHWRLVEPSVPEVFDHWQLNFSRLDSETILHAT